MRQKAAKAIVHVKDSVRVRDIVHVCLSIPLWGLLVACGSAPKICEEGETTPFRDCGSCVCQYGAWSCGCGDLPPVGGDGDGPSPKLCREGAKRTAACNTCTCSDGAWDCTEMDCENVCVPDTEVLTDCGKCSCSEAEEWNCETEGCAVETCDARSGAGCKGNRFCIHPEGSFCGVLGTLGTCVEESSSGCDTVYDPICGCDGRTYENSCNARTVGISVAVRGECPIK